MAAGRQVLPISLKRILGRSFRAWIHHRKMRTGLLNAFRKEWVSRMPRLRKCGIGLRCAGNKLLVAPAMITARVHGSGPLGPLR